jgi:hypothetical protein
VLKSFIELDKDYLSTAEVQNYTKIDGKTVGPYLASFTKKIDWLIRKRPDRNWEFNTKYKQDVIEVLREWDI